MTPPEGIKGLCGRELSLLVANPLDVIDRAYIIHDGSVLMEGTPSDIVNNVEVRRVYLGEKFSL